MYTVYVRNNTVSTSKVQADNPETALSAHLNAEGLGHTISGREVVFNDSVSNVPSKLCVAEVNGTNVFHFKID